MATLGGGREPFSLLKSHCGRAASSGTCCVTDRALGTALPLSAGGVMGTHLPAEGPARGAFRTAAHVLGIQLGSYRTRIG